MNYTIYTMKWIIFSAILAGFLSLHLIKVSNNNVCKTFEDYYTNRDHNENCYYNPDDNLKMSEIIKSRGYPAETHRVITEDGYIITLFRIPHGKNISNEKTKVPIFMQHGLGLSSESFVNTGKKSLAFMLADAGYDVWIGNFRGTTYARDHLHYNDTERKFWNFSFHEMGIYDIPAQLNLISDITQQKIVYIGYSMGTSVAYIYGSTYPASAQEKVKIFIGLAPGAFVREWKSVTRYIIPLWGYVEPIIYSLTNGVLFLREFPPRILKKVLCLPFPFQMHICQFSDMLVWGFDYEQNDPETLPVTLLQNSDSTSIKTLSHMIQVIRYGDFQHYNYGAEENKKVYGSLEPPHYDLSKLTVPVYLVRAENDLMATKKNVEYLNASLPEKVKPYDIYVVKNENFNHGDFLMAKDVVPLVYNHLLTFIKSL